MMLTHTWIDQYSGTVQGEFLREKVADAVNFDCGDTEEIPLAKCEEWANARAPFQTTLLQFANPSSSQKSHTLILWHEAINGGWSIIGAERARKDHEWRTSLPIHVTRNDDGSFHFEGYGYDDSELKAPKVFFAMALNLFYVLGCSNVATVDNAAPAALNKKRAKAGKFPVVEHKTLVVMLDAQRNVNKPQGGTHASPRVHLRRGHVRKMESGRRVWVQACVVGSKHGMVLKDYKISTASV
jgi:hypothetical protein